MKRFWKLITITVIALSVIGAGIILGNPDIAPLGLLISIVPSGIIAVW
jgi:hypothetical protein